MTSPTKAVLPGVTRQKIIQAAENLNIPFKEVEYSYSDVEKLDAMFISGTSPQVLPISCVGDIKLDVNNQIVRKLMLGYNELVKNNL